MRSVTSLRSRFEEFRRGSLPDVERRSSARCDEEGMYIAFVRRLPRKSSVGCAAHFIRMMILPGGSAYDGGSQDSAAGGRLRGGTRPFHDYWVDT